MIGRNTNAEILLCCMKTQPVVLYSCLQETTKDGKYTARLDNTVGQTSLQLSYQLHHSHSYSI